MGSDRGWAQPGGPAVLTMCLRPAGDWLGSTRLFSSPGTSRPAPANPSHSDGGRPGEEAPGRSLPPVQTTLSPAKESGRKREAMCLGRDPRKVICSPTQLRESSHCDYGPSPASGQLWRHTCKGLFLPQERSLNRVSSKHSLRRLSNMPGASPLRKGRSQLWPLKAVVRVGSGVTRWVTA